MLRDFVAARRRECAAYVRNRDVSLLSTDPRRSSPRMYVHFRYLVLCAHMCVYVRFRCSLSLSLSLSLRSNHNMYERREDRNPSRYGAHVALSFLIGIATSSLPRRTTYIIPRPPGIILGKKIRPLVLARFPRWIPSHRIDPFAPRITSDRSGKIHVTESDTRDFEEFVSLS